MGGLTTIIRFSPVWVEKCQRWSCGSARWCGCRLVKLVVIFSCTAPRGDGTGGGFCRRLSCDDKLKSGKVNDRMHPWCVGNSFKCLSMQFRLFTRKCWNFFHRSNIFSLFIFVKMCSRWVWIILKISMPEIQDLQLSKQHTPTTSLESLYVFCFQLGIILGRTT